MGPSIPSTQEALDLEPSGPVIPTAALGGEIFAGTCRMCHGEDGLNIPQCPLGSRQWLANMSLEGLMTRIRRGKPSSGMPTWGAAYGGPFSDEQILAITMYLGEVAR